MQLEFSRLNPTSEMVALTTRRNTKNLIITPAVLHGPLDPDKLAAAVHRAVDDFPQLGCTIKETKESGRRYLTWVPRPDLRFPVNFVTMGDRSTASERTLPTVQDLLGVLESSLDREWNLFEELPGEFHIVKVDHEHHLAVPVVHHVAADAGEASSFGRGVALAYRELVTGEKLAVEARVRGLSTAMNRIAPRKRKSALDGFSSLWKSVQAATLRPTLAQGSGSRDETREFHVKRLFSRQETLQISEWISRAGIRLSDVILACGNLAIDRWNAARHIEAGPITTAMTVNMEGRYSGLREPNATSVIFFKFLPEERQVPEDFLRRVSQTRARHFGRQMDSQLSGNLRRMLDSVRLLPLGARSRVVYHLVNKQQFSMTVTMLGVVWPLREGDRAFGESFPTEVGDTLITEVHGIGYKLLSSTPIVFIVYVFRQQLNVVMAAAGSLFTYEEAECFMDAFASVLMELSEGPPAG